MGATGANRSNGCCCVRCPRTPANKRWSAWHGTRAAGRSNRGTARSKTTATMLPGAYQTNISLFTPPPTCEQALERLAWYARRWTIESWHRVLKSGCRVEARQFGNYDRFVRATALFGVISWRILYATLVGRLDGDLSCETLL